MKYPTITKTDSTTSFLLYLANLVRYTIDRIPKGGIKKCAIRITRHFPPTKFNLVSVAYPEKPQQYHINSAIGETHIIALTVKTLDGLVIGLKRNVRSQHRI